MHSCAMKLQKELTAASSVPLVLSILAEGDSYGYAIIQRVKELSGGEIEWTDGMLYPVLHWLEDHEMVRSKWVEARLGSMIPGAPSFSRGENAQSRPPRRS